MWQREWLQGDVLEEQLQYWKLQLEGVEVLELPTDRARAAVASHRGAVAEFGLGRDLTQELKKLSREQGVTLFMTLLAAFQIVLSRYCGQDDVAVGTDVANRSRLETEGLIGFFVNQLVLRTDLSANPSLRELLGRVRETTLGAYAHQDLPFEKLVEELSPERDLTRSPLFQATFALQNAAPAATSLAGLKFSSFAGDELMVKFDLEVVMAESEQGLTGGLCYNQELFQQQSMMRMAEHLERLLESIASHPDSTIDQVRWLSPAQQWQLSAEFNDSSVASPHHLCFDHLLSQTVAASPDRIALGFENSSLSYQQLNDRAESLAERLSGLGAGYEQCVGVLSDRNPELVISLLGILKAGAVYLPLDPRYPAGRLEQVMRSSGSRVVISGENYRGKLSAILEQIGDQQQVVVIEVGEEHRQGEQVGEGEKERRGGRVEVEETNLAYVIYTSGSTGAPKGAMIEQGGMINHLEAKVEELRLSKEDVIGQTASQSFDISVWQMVAGLLVGARTQIIGEEASHDPGRLMREVEEERVTVVEVVPTMLRAIVEEDERKESREGSEEVIRVMVVTGEELEVGLCRRWMRGGRGVEVVNAYGPTECSDDVTQEVVSEEEELEGEDRMAIGRMMRNTIGYVSKREGEEGGIGIEGELWIGGAGVGRGYMNGAEETAARYKPDWVSGGRGKRIYGTGDRAKVRGDGRIEYLGRIDQQVKVRGHRIELGEIESVLQQGEGVKAAVVEVREDVRRGKRLVGYVEMEEGGGEEGVRGRLREKLPEWMVPSEIVRLEKLPMTANGKLDRKALPDPSEIIRASREGSGEALSPVEEIVAAIYTEVLGAEVGAATDNFFERGGHSLLATQVVSRIREALGVEIGLREIFERATVGEVASAVERERLDGRAAKAGRIGRASREGEIELSYAQARLWFMQQMEPESGAYNIATGVRLKGELRVEGMRQSLGEVVRRQEVLRTRIEEKGGHPFQVIEEAEEIEMGLVDLSGLEIEEREGEARRAGKEESRRAFDLRRGPVWRATVMRMEEREHVLLLNMHHVASDGWSTGVLIREFTKLYEGYRAGEQSKLEELAIQYADYAMWQRGWLQGEVLEEQLRYWKEQLEGVEVLVLPTDRARAAVASHRGAVAEFGLGREQTQELKKLGREQGVTLFMTLLAAFQLLLARHSSQQDIAVGTPIAGRNSKETEAIIGFFVNTLVMRGDFSHNPTTREMLRAVREVALGAYAHQEVPFEKLVEEMQPQRSLTHEPLFQVMMLYQSREQEGEGPEGIEM